MKRNCGSFACVRVVGGLHGQPETPTSMGRLDDRGPLPRVSVVGGLERQLGPGNDLPGGVMPCSGRVRAVATLQLLRLLPAYARGVVHLLLDRQVTSGSVNHQPALQRRDIIDDLVGRHIPPLHQRVPVRGSDFPRVVLSDLAAGSDAGSARPVTAVGEVAVSGLVPGNAAGQRANRLDLDQAPLVLSGDRVDLLQQPGADPATPVLRVHDQVQVHQAPVLRLRQLVRRSADDSLPVPGQQRMFGRRPARHREVGYVVPRDRDRQVVPLVHRHGVRRIQLPDGHARLPLPDCVGQVRRPRARLRAHRFQRHAI